MKKIKLILTMFVISVLIILMLIANSNLLFSASNRTSYKLDELTTYTRDNGTLMYLLGYNHALGGNNVFCVEHGKSWGEKGWFTLVTRIEIRNGKATFVKYKDDGITVDEDNSGPSNDENTLYPDNVLGAIVCDSRFNLGYGENTSTRFDSQLAVWYYWNDWVKHSGGEDYGLEKYNGNVDNLTTQEKEDAQAAIERARVYATEKLYNADIYYLKFMGRQSEENGGNPNDPTSGWQRLILVERGNPETPSREISVKKVWVDDGNAFENRPSEIEVQLKENNKIIDTITLSGNGNEWTGKFKELDSIDSNKTYSVEEVGVINGYQTSLPTGDPTNGFTITNTMQTININVTKDWDDGSNRDGNRPSELKIMLYERSGNNDEPSKDKDEKPRQITIKQNGSNKDKWTGSFTNLPTHRNGNPITYVVKEDENVVTELGYSISYTNNVINAVANNSTNNVTIKNSAEPEKVKVTIKKVWEDGNDRDGKRPESLFLKFNENYNSQIPQNATVLRVQISDKNGGWTDIREWLDENGNSINAEPVELNEENEWSFTTGYLYKNHEGGNSKSFRITESGMDDYDVYIEESTSDDNITFEVTNRYTPEVIEIPVTKKWEDDSDRDGKRPDRITLKLMSDDPSQDQPVQTKTIDGDGDIWQYTFRSTENEPIYKFKDGGNEINYRIEEEIIEYYEEPEIQGNSKSGFTITNTHIPERINIEIIKNWQDDLQGKSNLDEYRPKQLTITLYANNKVATQSYINKNFPNENQTLRNPVDISGNEDIWTHTFENLYKYENGEEINYSVREQIDHIKMEETQRQAYEVTYVDLQSTPATGDKPEIIKLEIINKHVPEYEGYIEITGTVWEDGAGGKGNDINGILDNTDVKLSGITVILRDENGNYFNSGNKTDGETSTAITDAHGVYSIKVNVDTTQDVYKLYRDPNERGETLQKRLEKAYVEFIYNANKYTTVKEATTGANTSKAKEREDLRARFDDKYSCVVPGDDFIKNCDSEKIIASTDGIIKFGEYNDKGQGQRKVKLKYGYGNRYIRTNPDGAWNEPLEGTIDELKNKNGIIEEINVDVLEIRNVNLGLFKREQPKVYIDSDISQVEVIVRNQQYTYIYNEKTEVLEADAKTAYDNAYRHALNSGMNEAEAREYATQEKIKVRFQEEDIYEYIRELNPADIAYLNDGGEAMKVFVTYKVMLGNRSTTLPITIHNIINCYDSEYSVESIKIGERNIQYNSSDYYKSIRENEANEILLKGLDIKLQPLIENQNEQVIEIKYKVSLEAIKALLKEDATLNNAVEIQSYSTQYGANTLYAEQRTGGRTNNPYGGYDDESQPGNADLYINIQGLIEAKKLEPDTDIAPSFVLRKDETPKVLSGTVWEDTDIDSSDKKRLGNGKNESENGIANVKVELLKVNEDGTMQTAYLYHRDDDEQTRDIRKKEAITFTDSQGNYSFGSNNPESLDYGYGVVTDKYVIKFIYGEESNKNARNYKSTIISNENENMYNVFKGTSDTDEWHLNINDGYSIAVDEIEERIKIEDLQYSNFEDTYNMIAYSKPFELQLEFDPSTGKTSAVSSDGKTGFRNELNIFDFGIIERAREDIFVETTIQNFKVTLANGQTLTEGNPNEKQLNYAKTIGFGKNIETGLEARMAFAKEIKMEIDTELVQGAELSITYAISITNNSEIDYEYYLGDRTEPFDKSKIKTEYYYFGEDVGAQEIKDSVKYLVYYWDKELTCTWDNNGWEEKEARKLYEDGLISKETYEAIDDKYRIYCTDKYKEIGKGKTEPEYMTATKLLSNRNEKSFNNHVEILKIDAKTARTIKESNVIKEYKMGNYVPSLEERKTYVDDNENPVYVPKDKEEVGFHEQDDDRVKVTITPPTGESNNIITHCIMALLVLIIIAIVIIYAKKNGIRKRKY